MDWRVMFRSRIKQLCLTGLASLLALSIATSGLTGTAHAESAESIRDFKNDITLLADGSAIIKETILYDFGTNQKHGLLRDIATSAILPSGKYFNYAITISSVTRNRQEESHKESQISSYLESKIGDPDATITGQHTYEITYSVDRVIQHDPAGDYLNWDIVGTQFKVPIEKSRTEIHVPSDIPLLDGMRCYTGGQGATASNCQIEKQGQNVTITTGNLSAREGATVNLLMKENSFQNYLLEEDGPPASELGTGGTMALFGTLLVFLVTFFAFPILIVIVLGLYLRNKHAAKRRQKQHTVIAQYEPPDGLSPAELGLLTDNIAGMIEVTATLIDLAVRGYIKIADITTGSFFKRVNYRFERLKDTATANKSLRPYELKLLTALFGAEKQVELKDVDRTAMSKTVTEIAKDLQEEMKQRGYFAQKQRWLANPDNVTEEGYKEWAKVEGFKLFLSVTEADRLKFTDAPAKKPEQFNELLPYAIALGVEKEWASQFAGMDIAQTTDWYSDGNGHSFSSVVLVSHLNTSFSSAVSSGFSTPSSSGGYGGGGFSGGGGGGGGGGSW